MDKTIGALLQFQAEAQERFEKQEGERVKREMELEESTEGRTENTRRG